MRGDAPDYSDVEPTLKEPFGVAMAEVGWFSSYRIHHRVAGRFRQGRVFLLGDAAHVHSSVGGQGMNTGLGDAHNLAWKLAAVLRGKADDRLLDSYDSYEAERRPFAQRIVRTTDQGFRFVTRNALLNQLLRGYVAPRVVGTLLRHTAEGAPSDPPPDRAPWLGRQIFGVLSQLGLRYPESPLSRGRAGRVRGGDRLPFVPLENGSNSGTLRSARPQLHVYGAVLPEAARWAEGRGVELHAFAYTPAAKAVGLAENAVYVVRPDVYVSAAQPAFGAAELDAVLAEGWRWRF